MEDCENLLGDMRRIDAASASSLQGDTEALCADILGISAVGAEFHQREGGETTTSSVGHAWARPVEATEDIHIELLLRVHKSTPPSRDTGRNKLRDIPGDILPDVKKSEKSKKQKTNELVNFIGASHSVRNMKRIQLFAPNENPSIFRRLHVDASKLLYLAQNLMSSVLLQSGATYMPYGKTRTELGALGPWVADLTRRRRTPPSTKL